jgi:hypothetical protein
MSWRNDQRANEVGQRPHAKRSNACRAAGRQTADHGGQDLDRAVATTRRIGLHSRFLGIPSVFQRMDTTRRAGISSLVSSLDFP